RGRFSSSPRSRSPPRPSRGCAACSAIRSPCSTRGSRMGSAPTPGVRYGAASAWWRWGRGRRCARRCSGSPPSWSTRRPRRAPRVAEARGIPWTEPLDHAVRSALSRAEQVILLLNRRGFATYLQCPACGDVRVCPHCAIALTVHQTPRALRCHYCGHEEPIPTACRLCGKETQRMRGLGTQQLEHFVGLRFPEARIARMDLDTTSTK